MSYTPKVQKVVTLPVSGDKTPQTTQALLYLPDDYTTSNNLYPLIISLPGTGEQGTDLVLLVHGGQLAQRIESGFKPQGTAPDGTIRKYIVITPQGPPNSWGWAGQLQYLIPSLVSQYRIDTQRMYITGLSAGGWGTWMAIAVPAIAQMIAAIAPVSPANSDNEAADINNIVKYGIAVWTICGTADSFWTIPSQKYTADFNAANPPIKAILTGIPGVGHSAWNQAYDPNWTDIASGGKNLYDWFAQFSLGTIPVITPPPVIPPPVTNKIVKSVTFTYTDGTTSTLP